MTEKDSYYPDQIPTRELANIASGTASFDIFEGGYYAYLSFKRSKELDSLAARGNDAIEQFHNLVDPKVESLLEGKLRKYQMERDNIKKLIAEEEDNHGIEWYSDRIDDIEFMEKGCIDFLQPILDRYRNGEPIKVLFQIGQGKFEYYTGVQFSQKPGAESKFLSFQKPSNRLPKQDVL